MAPVYEDSVTIEVLQDAFNAIGSVHYDLRLGCHGDLNMLNMIAGMLERLVDCRRVIITKLTVRTNHLSLGTITDDIISVQALMQLSLIHI